jgi:hypothetical protein
MSMTTNIAQILGRSLTQEETISIANFQSRYDIDDSDPIAIVLALVGANTVLMNSIPALLQQKAEETIELHRRTLMDQSTIIAKELIANLSEVIAHQNTSLKVRLVYTLSGTLCGSILTAVLLWLIHN